MIRTESEYQEAIRRFNQDREVAEKQKQALISKGYNPEEVERGMQPLLSFHYQLEEEITSYENLKRGNFTPARRLTDLGRLLIGMRIASGLTQKQFADHLGVKESQVSRDERNEYHGITLARAQRIIDMLQANVTTTVSLGEAVFQK